uniref:28S ribosomal protein S24, mitochondrial n=1 Tax=Ascaris lumbricoides TaxID=6252 RepID=A0A0M3HT91_ASCLU
MTINRQVESRKTATSAKIPGVLRTEAYFAGKGLQDLKCNQERRFQFEKHIDPVSVISNRKCFLLCRVEPYCNQQHITHHTLKSDMSNLLVYAAVRYVGIPRMLVHTSACCYTVDRLKGRLFRVARVSRRSRTYDEDKIDEV